MLNPDIPPDQLERIRPTIEALLARISRQAATLAPLSDSALIYQLLQYPVEPEAGR